MHTWKFIIQTTRIQQRLYCSRSKPKNHYESLGIKSDSTQTEIKSAYYKLSMLHHPDKNQGNEKSLQKFRDITEAYEVLGNNKTRRLYDRQQFVHYPQNTRNAEPSSSYKPKVTRPATQPGTRTGSVPIYDFDEWSRTHYAQTFQRQQENKRNMENYMRMKKQFSDTTKLEGMIIGLVMLIIIGCVWRDYENYDKISTGVDTSQYRKKS